MRRHRSLGSLFLSIAMIAGTTSLLPLVAQASPAAETRRAGDGESLAFLVAVNEHEIATAKQALGKGVTGAVRDFATKMQTEHGQNLADTRRLARETGAAVVDTEEVKALRAKTRDERMSLQKLSGAAYSAAFVEAMVNGHAEVLAKLDDKLIPQSVDPKVIAHLKATRAHVAEHLAAAKALEVAK
jgi:putative membrane protein